MTVAVLAAGLAIWRHQQGPKHGGLRLEEWARIANETQSESDFEKFDRAVQALGTNAVSPLLKLLTSEYPNWKLKVNSTPVLRAIQWDRLFPDDHELVNFGSRGFEILGSNAVLAIPELAKLMSHANESHSRSAAYALGCIGVEARPFIIAALTNTDPKVRTSALIFGCLPLKTNAALALPLIVANLANTDARERFENTAALALLQIEPSICVPALQTRLHDPVPNIRYAAIEGLAKFGTNAVNAISELAQLRSDPDPIIRALSFAALRKIAPEKVRDVGDDEHPLPAEYRSPLTNLP